jgi:hypothetical protein
VWRLPDRSPAPGGLSDDYRPLRLSRHAGGGKRPARLSGGHHVSITLLAKYKHLEQEMVALAGMADDDCYHAMLIERLGLILNLGEL